MIRLIVLDISGMYSKIVDEIYGCKERIESEIEQYNSDDYVLVRVTY